MYTTIIKSIKQDQHYQGFSVFRQFIGNLRYRMHTLRRYQIDGLNYISIPFIVEIPKILILPGKVIRDSILGEWQGRGWFNLDTKSCMRRRLFVGFGFRKLK